jgi:hypothetical protein
MSVGMIETDDMRITICVDTFGEFYDFGGFFSRGVITAEKRHEMNIAIIRRYMIRIFEYVSERGHSVRIFPEMRLAFSVNSSWISWLK